MKAFYLPEIELQGFLSEAESHHALQVLRLQAGDPILLLDGKGCKAKAIVHQVQKKKCGYEVVDREFGKPNKPSIHIAVAPPRSADRIDFLIEKLVESGADTIHLLECQNSERRTISLPKLEQTAIAALKQCKRFYLPVIKPLQSLGSFLENDPCKDKRVAALLPEASPMVGMSQEDLSLLIGPEGDFSSEEYSKILAHGYAPVRLSGHILRTESAAAFACFALYLSRLNSSVLS
jgi:16S rRNA (uracil1498-N3)-methyltransferase